MRAMHEPVDEDELDHDVDEIEVINLRAPVRRDIVDRPPSYRGRPSHLSVAELRLAEHRLGCDRNDQFSPVRGLVVGQNPGPNTHPDLPLFPWPDTSSAGRLVEISGLTPGQYLGGLYRRNLVDAHLWRKSRARRRARSILTALFDMPKSLRVVLCGVKVMRAFDLREEPWKLFCLESRQACVVVPHPSGLNRVYNDEEARLRTRAWMRWAALGEDRPR